MSLLVRIAKLDSQSMTTVNFLLLLNGSFICVIKVFDDFIFIFKVIIADQPYLRKNLQRIFSHNCYGMFLTKESLANFNSHPSNFLFIQNPKTMEILM